VQFPHNNMDIVFALDRQLFFVVNGSYHTPVLDTLALVLSGVGTAGIIWFLIAVILFMREEKKDHWFFASVGLAGGASFIIVELMLKPLVGRMRPDGSEGFSFPSGHATIAFAMAVVLSQKEPKWKWLFYMLAVLISLSRVYLGAHYPLDIIAGSALGLTIGFLSLRVLKFFHTK